MRLALFDFVENTLALLEQNEATYIYAEGLLKKVFGQILQENGELAVGLTSRIKTKESLKEKLIRNRFYLKYQTPQEAIDNLHDLIGLTIECRFIAEEQLLFKHLFEVFEPVDQEDYRCVHHPDIRLNLRMPQPQLQRNGFTIYRMDGYLEFNGQHINYELQIKSLVHSFWNEVEHQVVYKNTQFVIYDSFMKNLLGSIRDNLDVVDRQLQIVYKQLDSQGEQSKEIGMSPEGFKTFLAKSINDLAALKMQENMGIVTDFRKSASILSQYIFINDFINAPDPRQRMMDYFEQLNLLQISEIRFDVPLSFEEPFHSSSPFCDTLGKYWEQICNQDYEWHVFFVLLFELEPGNNIQDFTHFVEVIKNLIMPAGWYSQRFNSFNEEEAKQTRDFLEGALAQELVRVNQIDIIYEDKLIELADYYRSYVEQIESTYTSYQEVKAASNQALKPLIHKVDNLFKS